MLKRIYVNNFRCLVNFELTFDNINLILGYNGSGKSTLFDVIRKLQSFIVNDFKAEEVFDYSDLTRWQDSNIQSFELEFTKDSETFKYCLTIEYPKQILQTRILYESLIVNDQELFRVDFVKTQKDDSSFTAIAIKNEYEKTNIFKFNTNRSGINLLYTNVQYLNWFKISFTNFFVVHINPFDMNLESRSEEHLPNYSLSNFSAWYSHLSQSEQGKIIKLTLELQKVLTGFDSFQNTKIGEARLLSAVFTKPSKATYKFNELSEGQKVLIALYTLLYCTPDEDCTLMIDEPENFLALPEIQPWLSKLIDRCQENDVQAILISHHPSLINTLATDYGYWFERKDNQAVRVQKIVDEGEEGGLSIAKLIEMKWIYDQ